MSSIVIGRVKSSKGNSYEVRWDAKSGDVYVSPPGKHIGKAKTAREAMALAEGWAYHR